MTEPRGIDLVRHMQYFLAVADELHFGRAAEDLGMSQPPLSQGIQRLERRLGRRLFDRAPGVALTSDGQALVPKARALVRAAGDILEPPAAQDAGLRLGVIPQLPAAHVATLIGALGARDGLAPTTITASSVELVRRVGDRRLDAAVVAHPVVLDDLTTGSDVLRLRTWALVPESHPAARRRSVRLDALHGSTLAIAARADNPAAHDLTADVARAAGIEISPIPAADDRAALLVAAAGRALTLTADPQLDGPGCRRVALVDDPLPLRVRVIRRAGAGPDLDVGDAILTALRRVGR